MFESKRPKRTYVHSKNSYVLGDQPWPSRRPAKTGPEVTRIKFKFPPKVMTFGGIARNDESRLVAYESGTVGAEVHIGEFVNQNAIMNRSDCRCVGVRQCYSLQEVPETRIFSRYCVTK
jgi:hypothetical protein